MKTLILILASFCIFNTESKSQCITWRTDYGSEQDARANSLKHEIHYYKTSMNQLKTIKNYDRDVLLARAATRQLLSQKQIEHQRLMNKCFKDRTGPQFEIRY